MSFELLSDTMSSIELGTVHFVILLKINVGGLANVSEQCFTSFLGKSLVTELFGFFALIILARTSELINLAPYLCHHFQEIVKCFAATRANLAQRTLG